MTNNIELDLFIDASIAEVFKAVSEPSRLEKWWPLACSGKQKVDALYNLNFTDDYDWYGKVTAYEKNKTFAIKMVKSDADWDPTTFSFNLIRKNDKVLLEFRHTDWPANNLHFRHSTFCWANLLNGLKVYVENGTITPFEDRS